MFDIFKFSASLITAVFLTGLCAVSLGQDIASNPEDLDFTCVDRPYGYYADVQTNCQVNIYILKRKF